MSVNEGWMGHTVVWFIKGYVSLITVLQQHTHKQCALHNTPLKSPHSLLCSANSDPLFAIPASNNNITFSPFPSPWPVRQGSQAPTAGPKIIVCNKDGCVSVYQVKTRNDISFKTLTNIDRWKNWDMSLITNGWLRLWMADWGHAPDRLLPHTVFSYKIITDQAALLEVIGIHRRVTWQNQIFLIADNTLNKAWQTHQMLLKE